MPTAENAQAQSVRREKLPQLDALRGICALMVALNHAEFQSPFRSLSLIRNGALFVDFFFVLSGFIIAYNYQNLSTVPQLGRFMGLRLARVYPLHFVMLIGFLLYECFQWAVATGMHLTLSTPPFSESDSHGFILNLLLLNGVGLRPLSFNVPAWSISTEFWTYLLFGLTTITFAGRTRLQGYVFSAIALAALTILLFVNPEPSLTHDFRFFFPRCVFSFFMGAVLCLVLPARRPLPASELKTAATSSTAGTSWQIVALVMAVIAVSVPGRGSRSAEALEFAAPFVFTFVIAVFARFPDTSVVRWLTRPALVWLGTVSYSIYMVHMLVLLPFEATLRMGFHLPKTSSGIMIHPALGALVSVVYVACVLLLASITYRFVEAPGRDWGRELLTRRRHAARVRTATSGYMKE